MTFLNVNTKGLVVYTNKLEKMHKSAFPVVVRQTLNSAAFDVKQKTMPNSARRFEKRSANFFKANSKVYMAKGFDLKSMKAVTGFVSNKLRGGDNYSVRDLEQQEHGGRIKGKSFIPLNDARKGGYATAVRPSNRLSKVKRVVNQNKYRGSKKAQFVKAVHKAKKGGYVIGGTSSNKKFLFKVTGYTKKRFKVKPLYSYQENRSVKVRQTKFMKSAAIMSSKKLGSFYVSNAKKKLLKSLK